MPKNSVSLSEEDYLAIINLQRHFVQCRSRDGLNAYLKNHFLPLLNCDSMGFGWRDMDLAAKQVSNVSLIGYVGITSEDAEYLGKITPYSTSINKNLLTGNRHVIACDVDVPRKTLYKETALFQSDYPEYQHPKSAVCIVSGKKMTTYMAAIDRFDNGLGMGVHRLFPNDKPFTLRDVRAMELVRLILFQSIKFIILNEELARHQSLAESLADIPTGVALVRKDMRVIFINKAFKHLIPLEPGHKLPDRLAADVKEMDSTEPLQDTLPNQPFYKIRGGTFRLGIDLVNKDTEGPCYLLRLKPANDAFSQLNVKMQAGDLSNREKEICCLAKDGFTNVQIADRLFLSPHTVKTHMKNIYKKMGVQKRSKLVALLNRKE